MCGQPKEFQIFGLMLYILPGNPMNVQQPGCLWTCLCLQLVDGHSLAPCVSDKVCQEKLLSSDHLQVVVFAYLQVPRGRIKMTLLKQDKKKMTSLSLLWYYPLRITHFLCSFFIPAFKSKFPSGINFLSLKNFLQHFFIAGLLTTNFVSFLLFENLFSLH